MNIPKGVSQKIEKIFNNFLWTNKSSKYHWKAWSKLCKPKESGGLGFRTIQDSLAIHYTKLWVKFRKQDSLWSNFVFHKYCSNSDPNSVQAHVSDSMCWKAMLKWRTTAESFIRWELGDGRVSFWYDSWMTKDPKEGLVGPFSPYFQVLDCWMGSHWDEEILKYLVPTDIKNHILQIPIDPLKEDTLHLPFPSKQQFSKAIHSKLQPFARVRWGKEIWHHTIKISQTFFLWRILHHILPTDDILKLKGIRIPSICLLCRKAEEDLDHIFMECDYSMAIWQKIDKFLHLNLALEPTTSAFIYKILHIPLCHKLASIFFLWYVWQARNLLKHSGERKSSTAVFLQVSAQLAAVHRYCRLNPKQLDSFTGSVSAVTPRQFRYRLVSWQPPSSMQFKINVDGSFSYDNDNAAGWGIIGRNHLGQCLFFMSSECPALDPLSAECYALLAAVFCCSRLKHCNWIVETDNELLFRILSSNEEIPWSIVYLIRQIKMLSSNCNIVWSLVLREANQPADLLARNGALTKELLLDSSPPPFLKFLLQGDIISIPHIRSVFL